MKSAPRPRRPAGFTLVELLAVIAIVGVLAAITIVAVGHARKSAQSSRCVSNLRQLGIAVLARAADHKGQIPMPTPTDNVRWHGYIVWDAPGGAAQWCYFGKLYEEGYLTDGRVFYCPTALEGQYDYDSQWGARVRGPGSVSGGFRIGYAQRIAAPGSNPRVVDGVNYILATDHFVGNYSDHGNKRINIVHLDGSVRTDRSGSRWAMEPTAAFYNDWERHP